MNTQLVELGTEALNYISTNLAGGNSLSRNYLSSLRLDLGRVFVRAPRAAPPEAINQFDKGGLTQRRFTVPTLVESILEHLRSNSSAFVVFDGILARRNDPILLRSAAKWFSFNQEVYFYLTATDATESDVLTALRLCNWYPFISVLTVVAGEEQPSKGSDVEAGMLEIMGKNAKSLLVGAYDGEGFICWSRRD